MTALPPHLAALQSLLTELVPVEPIQRPRRKPRCRVCDDESTDVCWWCGPDTEEEC